MTGDSLKIYRAKRDFRQTSEPEGRPAKKTKKSLPIFVIQKHDASRLHYDFRLEVKGVLKSWAVPKGLSSDPRDRRLAVQTEDHPLEYADFEGTIPKGEYGGGKVTLWDRGVYAAQGVEEALEKGHVVVWLKGKKAKGAYALIRIRSFRGKRDKSWLVVKMRDR